MTGSLLARALRHARAKRARRRSTRLGILAGVLLISTVLAPVVLDPSPADAASLKAHNPIGRVELVKQKDAGFVVKGWAIDPDTTKSIKVAVYVDGKTAHKKVTASITRKDVAKVHRSAGTRHGYEVTLPWKSGSHTICVKAVNAGRGSASSVQIGCKTLKILYNPLGTVDGVLQVPGGLQVAGWAFDPTSPKSTVKVALSVTGATAAVPAVAAGTTAGGVTAAATALKTVKATTVATISRSALAKAHPEAGAKHGYSVMFAAPNGAYSVCVTLKNLGKGADSKLACKSITLDFSPIGAITSLAQAPGGFTVTGWASDPDTTAALSTAVVMDGKTLETAVANQDGPKTGYSITRTYQVPAGTHSICLYGVNVGQGASRNVACRSITLNYNPTVQITSLAQAIGAAGGIVVNGWAVDPDTTDPVTVSYSLDGAAAGSGTANAASGDHSGHAFSASLPTTVEGVHTVCVAATNLSFGTPGPGTPVCQNITVSFSPVGSLDAATRAADGTSMSISGWAIDLGTADPINVVVTIDGAAQPPVLANVDRPSLATARPGYGTTHGFAITLPRPGDDWEHTVCVTAVNVGSGADVQIGCGVIIAVHPVAPSAPQGVSALSGYGGATVTWQAPASDGGAPATSYVVTSAPGNVVVTVAGTATTATIAGLKAKTSYTFSVIATNVAGASPAAVSAAIITQAAPPPQTTPAPISTSRYIRNIANGRASDATQMKAEGLADAKANPGGHGYLMLLDIGGQSHSKGGVILSATTRFISYASLVTNVQAYVDGYAAGQLPSAPATIAIGTNNDMDVSSTTGKEWADKVVDPIVTYAKKYAGVTIVGANDVEPGFRASYAATKSWLSGYLAATKAPFLFNGSADGCSPSKTAKTCNNGWTMAGLYGLGGGQSPTRIRNLPQIYNTTMAKQWKYISLTGIATGKPKINFGGPLTEWTACAQAKSCGSLTGASAWQEMWNQLQSDSRLKVSSLPYSTDLRIDK
ncbi:MAG TPA: fibronectin type III domain-containing protein [Jatrophihabitans sp.]|jgi:hypothetical protein